MTVLMRHQSIDLETYKQVFKLNPNFENYVQSYLYEAVRAGNRKLAHFMISNMVKYPNFGFNQLHADVLSDDAVLDKVLRVSVTKKANTNRDITPLHCACINPNPKFLKALMETGPELQTVDTDLKRPVHYAGACEGPEPLKLLIAAGANLTDQDNKKRNCLHYAAMNGRAENIRLILLTSPNLVSIRDRKSMTPIAYACKNGHTEAVKVLLEFKAKLNVGAG
jgi:ankyrin repeat protein